MSTAVAAIVAPSAPANRPLSTITAVAWIAERDLNLAEWGRQGQRLGLMDRCSAWWIGDWIRYGNAKFGEKYTRVAKITGYDVQTLMNRVYVASRFPISRRRENLSWSHHETVASLECDDQDRWLDRVVERKMSVADLRLELRSRQKGHGELSSHSAVDGTECGQDVAITCPKCGHSIRSREVQPQVD
jgi:hypothetical protein